MNAQQNSETDPPTTVRVERVTLACLTVVLLSLATSEQSRVVKTGLEQSSAASRC